MGRNRKSRRLKVFINGNLVGVLSHDFRRGLEFQYATSWLKGKNPSPISQSLPLQERPYRGERLSFYFDNLLPDNPQVRQRIAQTLGAKSTEAFDLLTHVGRDCVGALQLISEGGDYRFSPRLRVQKLSSKRISEIIQNLKFLPLGMSSSSEFRISIAGAQEKTALLRWKKAWYQPIGTTPTSHILKPPMGKLRSGIDLSNSVENEWLCLKLAERLGLSAAQSEMESFEDSRVLAVERFDRRWIRANSLLRIPQEDLCQAMGVPSTRKYEKDGGPGIQQIMDFLRASDVPDQDRETFIRAQLVFFLLGAVDGHAKNFSIFLTPQGFRLTPLYDILSVFPALDARQIEIKKVHFAMGIGDRRIRSLRDIQRRHWEQTCKRSGFSPARFNALVKDLAERSSGLGDFKGELMQYPVSENLVDCLLRWIRRQLKILSP